MKKTVSVLLAVILMFSLSVSAFAANLTPTADKKIVKAGEAVTVTLSLDEDIADVNTIAYKLYFNPALFDVTSSKSTVDGGYVTMSTVKTNAKGSYVNLSTMDSTSEGQLLKAGSFAEVTFTAKADVTEQQAAFTAEFENCMLKDFTMPTHGAGPAATVTVTRDYSVTVSGTGAADVTAAQKATHGTDYSFTLNKAENYYTVAVTVGGVEVTPTLGEDGKTYTIAGASITGDIAITVTKTAKQYNVTVSGAGAADVTAEKKATHGTNYSFILNKAENYDYTVAVTVGGESVTPTLGEDGKTYTIAGASITGNIVITVTKTEKTPEITTTAITFTGSGANDVAGGTSQTAANGQDFTFTVNKDANYDYTVKLDGETLTESNGQYTIPAAKLTGTALTVTVTKTAKTPEKPEDKPLPTPVGPKPGKKDEPTEPGTTEPTEPVKSFTDVPAGAYYEEAVTWAVEKGITKGTSETTFAPKALCTRAQVVTFLWRAAGCPEPQSGSSFTDVTAGSYYAKAVTWAIENGITGGTGDGMFSPDAVCTRAQAVTFLYRAFSAAASDGVSSFSDVDADAYYAAAVRWAEQNGITGGIGGGLFGPDLDCTREQIITFIFRSLMD